MTTEREIELELECARLRAALKEAGCKCQSAWKTGEDHYICKRCNVLNTPPPDPSRVLRLAAVALMPCEAGEYCGCCSEALRTARTVITPEERALLEGMK